jgi:hypothetical protein
MPYRRFDWHEHIAEVWGEFRAARAAVDRLKAELANAPDLLISDRVTQPLAYSTRCSDGWVG